MLAIPASLICQQSSPPATLPAYDVVSVHPNNSASGSTRMSTNPGTLDFTNVTLNQMLAYAYEVRERLVSGLPSWAESAHFDVSAKVVEPNMEVLRAMDRHQRSAMFISVLAGRFGAVVHMETKTLPVYELVLAKAEPRFQQYVPPAGDAPSSGPNMGAGSSTHNLSMAAVGVPMSSLAEILSGQVDRTVIDKTGLPGKYNLELKFTPDGYRRNGAAVEPTDEAPSIYTALQEQLGLKLVPAKGPVATLVVDQLKVPAEN